MENSCLSLHIIQFIMYTLNIQELKNYSRTGKYYNQNIMSCFLCAKPPEMCLIIHKS